jgi:MFS-type transporter involved in bile tolerance (Atg22 family)
MEIMVISVLVSVVVFPLLGSLLDKYKNFFVLPLSFVFRCISTILFTFVARPNTFFAYFVCVLMVVATITETIANDSVF